MDHLGGGLCSCLTPLYIHAYSHPPPKVQINSIFIRLHKPFFIDPNIVHSDLRLSQSVFISSVCPKSTTTVYNCLNPLFSQVHSSKKFAVKMDHNSIANTSHKSHSWTKSFVLSYYCILHTLLHGRGKFALSFWLRLPMEKDSRSCI